MTRHRARHPPGKSSAWYRARVEQARHRQAVRYASLDHVRCNAQLPASLIQTYCPLTAPAETLLSEQARLHGLSSDIELQLLTLARTAADLTGHEVLEDSDITAALNAHPLLAARRMLGSAG
jgi:magnesium chelatase family protein